MATLELTSNISDPLLSFYKSAPIFIHDLRQQKGVCINIKEA